MRNKPGEYGEMRNRPIQKLSPPLTFALYVFKL